MNVCTLIKTADTTLFHKGAESCQQKNTRIHLISRDSAFRSATDYRLCFVTARVNH